ncbi:MAG: type II toxin-antitoxin system VapB family antitoxin [Verrucomicrobiota bacterium]|nr:type II toxin-antitoxin system VapB family antitoxin [Verrucomicrobiota bacterium]
MRTTININDALLDEVRRRVGAAGRPFRLVLEETIALGLASSKRTKTRRRVRIRPQRLGLKPVYRKLSLNQLYDQLEAERTVAKPARPAP